MKSLIKTNDSGFKPWVAVLALGLILGACSSSEVNEGEESEASVDGSEEIQTADTLSTDATTGSDPLGATTTTMDDPSLTSPDQSQDLSGLGAPTDAPSNTGLLDPPKPQRKIAKRAKKPKTDFETAATTQNIDPPPPPPIDPPPMPDTTFQQTAPTFTPQTTVAQNTYTPPERTINNDEPKGMFGGMSKNKVVGAGVLLLAAGGFMLFRRRFSAPKY